MIASFIIGMLTWLYLVKICTSDLPGPLTHILCIIGVVIQIGISYPFLKESGFYERQEEKKKNKYY